MKKYLSRGFTMIELLIVIAVLGILAVAVLAAINPIEQINRGRDTGTRSDAEQLIGAIDRYYASKGYYPWMLSATSDNDFVDFVEIAAVDQAIGGDAQPMLTNLSASGTEEVKLTFVNRIVAASANLLSIYKMTGGGYSTYLCFVPQSSSFRTEAYKRCVADPTYGDLPADFPTEACPAASCTDVGADEPNLATACYSCLP
ncbi:hypothetical protein A2Z41_02820 [Microgenomates group bacterium RBG_19FT_COMBO_39_10]|nr:MAG: hypothetical protein A2Z41_02820 [Microgenomates group bacterium RBG_19FT_COMBO_39_10]